MDGSGNGSRTYWFLGRRCRAPSVTPSTINCIPGRSASTDLIGAVCAEYAPGRVTSQGINCGYHELLGRDLPRALHDFEKSYQSEELEDGGLAE